MPSTSTARETDPGGPATTAAPRPVLVVGADPATRGLLDEWLAAEGWSVACDAHAADCALAIVDVPYPRDSGLELLRRVTAEHPGTPVLAISATFFSTVARCGPCARALGVAGVLPKPLTREALLAAVRELARRAP